ncbi:O-acetylhomoserine aminocarboxypropyltransferase/cysteine synthase family protein [Melioribacter sp. Ez-97]|uniref:O-acetylhomoserine aminocarboxypropyltransferase/cysteine synthase family protein n=1 Tax=Melioribacter sp. Ez-97 TaxID=3423434 RepID=UPI003ED8FE38
MNFETAAVHAGSIKDSTGATHAPVYQSASFAYEKAGEIESVFQGKKFGYVYSRISNPTVTAFELRMNALEGGIGAIATSSGMSAIATTAFTLAENGSEIVASKSLFGGTYLFFKEIMESSGVKVIYADFNSVDDIEKSISERTRFLFLESISNPKLEIYDLKKISETARKYNLPLVVDNTVTTPYLWRAKDLGADIIIHSATKYITGNGTAVGGVLIDTGNYKWNSHPSTKIKSQLGKAGPFAFIAAARSKVYQHLGFAPAPQNVFFHQLGLETLALRMERHCSNALKLAEFFKEQPGIKSVNYPGLNDNRYRQTGLRQFGDRYGGLLTVELDCREKCFDLIDNLKYAKNLANIGDTKTLIIHPESTIYSNCGDDEKSNAGVNSRLLRISVGIEYINDIIEDFSSALEKI